jgi:peptide-methionine (S)-S-oxide reductase
MKYRCTALLLPFVVLLVSPNLSADTKTQIAIFAGGCFWCMEEAFEQVEGVISVRSGYHGGNRENPTYEEVSSGTTGHFESIEVVFDPTVVTYQELLSVFWRNVDPLNSEGQFCDRGPQYRSAIFYHDESQKQAVEESFLALENSSRFEEPITTAVHPATQFYQAEDYHQDYYKKNPLLYKYYKFTCGRASRLEDLWRDDGA